MQKCFVAQNRLEASKDLLFFFFGAWQQSCKHPFQLTIRLDGLKSIRRSKVYKMM
jgi:hypothetical protein